MKDSLQVKTFFAAAILMLAVLVAAVESYSPSAYLGSVYYGSILGMAPVALVLLASILALVAIGVFLIHSRYYVLLLTLTLVAGSFFQILPLLHGYFLYAAGDPSNHLGIVKTVVANGVTPSADFYPGLHILGSSLVLMTGIPILDLPVISGEVLYSVFILGGMLLVKSLSDSQGSRRLAYLFLPAVPMNLFLPEYFAFALLPLVAAAALTKGYRATIVYSIGLVALTIIHPLVAVMLGGSILVYTLVTPRDGGLVRAVLPVVTVGTWVGYNVVLTHSLAVVIQEFAFGLPTSSPYVSSALTHLGIFSTVEIALRLVGPLALLVGVELVVMISTKSVNSKVGLFFFFLLFSIAMAVFGSVVQSSNFGPDRFIEFATVGCVIGVICIHDKMSSHLRAVLLTVLLVSVAFASFAGAYASWYSFQSDQQVSQSMYVSDSWLFDHLVPGSSLGGPFFSGTNSWNLVRGTPPDYMDLSGQVYNFATIDIPYHFDTSGLGNINEGVLVLTRVALVMYSTIYSGTNTFDRTDFSNLVTNCCMDFVYSSQGQDLFSFHQD